MKDMCLIFCAPLNAYPNQPKDQSKCELIDCPVCNEKMWLSEKKKYWLGMSKGMDRDIFLACYPCFMKWANKKVESGEMTPDDILDCNLQNSIT